MTLNPAAQATRTVDVIDGAISEYYDLIDDALHPSEQEPGKYNVVTSGPYMNPCPQTEPGWTTISIGTNDPRVVLVDQSFLTAEYTIKLKCDTKLPGNVDADQNAQAFFIGWKSSMEGFREYHIEYNNRNIYQQTSVGEESLVYQSTLKEDIREKRPEQYTTYTNAYNMDQNVCGTYFVMKNTSKDKEFEVHIRTKIALNQIPFFSEFKYLPGWAGNWSIRLYPSSQNLVICPLRPGLVGAKIETHPITYEFTQIGHKFYAPVRDAADTKWEGKEIAFTAVSCTLDKLESNLVTLEMYRPLYMQLKARYIDQPLTIPFQQFLWTKCSGSSWFTGEMHANWTGALTCCDSMFLLPLYDDSYHTVCKNPFWKNFQLNADTFGNYPQQAIQTYDEAGAAGDSFTRYMNLTLDALNLNCSPLIGMTSELSNSLHGNRRIYYEVTDAQTDAKAMTYNTDATSFMLGIPFSHDEDFQGGINSLSNVTMIMNTSAADGIALNAANGQKPAEITTATYSPPSIVFVLDKAVCIRPNPNDMFQAEVAVLERKFR